MLSIAYNNINIVEQTILHDLVVYVARRDLQMKYVFKTARLMYLHKY